MTGALIHLHELSGRIHRNEIYLRDSGSCCYCGVPIAFKAMTLDHITPKSKGGGMSYRNLVCCCRACNQSKGDRYVWHWWATRPHWQDAWDKGRVNHLHRVVQFGR